MTLLPTARLAPKMKRTPSTGRQLLSALKTLLIVRESFSLTSNSLMTILSNHLKSVSSLESIILISILMELFVLIFLKTSGVLLSPFPKVLYFYFYFYLYYIYIIFNYIFISISLSLYT